MANCLLASESELGDGGYEDLAPITAGLFVGMPGSGCRLLADGLLVKKAGLRSESLVIHFGIEASHHRLMLISRSSPCFCLARTSLGILAITVVRSTEAVMSHTSCDITALISCQSRQITIATRKPADPPGGEATRRARDIPMTTRVIARWFRSLIQVVGRFQGDWGPSPDKENRSARWNDFKSEVRARAQIGVQLAGHIYQDNLKDLAYLKELVVVAKRRDVCGGEFIPAVHVYRLGIVAVFDDRIARRHIDGFACGGVGQLEFHGCNHTGCAGGSANLGDYRAFQF